MLQPDQFYHIYNHANGNENLFREEKNYFFFLQKIKRYLSPYITLYAYCLMPNHFHLLVRIRGEWEIKNLFINSETYQHLGERERDNFIYKKISKAFANLGSSYAQALNKMYGRKGSLFMPNFKNNPVEDDLAFCKLIHYIHANPVHHGFVRDLKKWRFSSYHSLLSEKDTKLERTYVMSIFGGRKAFLEYHSQPVLQKNKWHDL